MTGPYLRYVAMLNPEYVSTWIGLGTVAGFVAFAIGFKVATIHKAANMAGTE